MRWSRPRQNLTKSFVSSGKNKGTATRFTNETRLFFKDDGSTLWITFVGECLYGGFVEATPPKRHADGNGVWRKIAGGWSCTDRGGAQLTKDRLSGALTKLGAYRGTSCRIDVADYAVRRINGQKTSEVERATEASREMKPSVRAMMKLLTWRDLKRWLILSFRRAVGEDRGLSGKLKKP